MATTVKRSKREIRDHGTVTAEITFGDVGKTIDFMGVPAGFRVVGVNVTVDEAFDNANNTVAIGIDGDTTRFLAASAMNTLTGYNFNQRQFTAAASTAILATIAGDASTAGKATITVAYAKLPAGKQDY